MDKTHRGKNLILVSLNLKSPQPDLPTNLKNLRIREERSRCVRCSAFALPPTEPWRVCARQVRVARAQAGHSGCAGARAGLYLRETPGAQGGLREGSVPLLSSRGEGLSPEERGSSPGSGAASPGTANVRPRSPGDAGHSSLRRRRAPEGSGRRLQVTRGWTLATVIFHPSCNLGQELSLKVR